MSRTLVVTWDVVPLIRARRFITYTVTLDESSSKRQAPSNRTVPCSRDCRLDFVVVPGQSYTVAVGITGFSRTFTSGKHIV